MNRLAFLLAATLTLPVAAAVQAEDKPAPHPDDNMVVIAKKPDVVSIPRIPGSSQLQNWFVLDNRNIVVEVANGRYYKATLMNSCPGLRFTDRLGFSTQGPFALDKWTTLHLPDGTRCYVKDLAPYTRPAREADAAGGK